MRRSPPGGRHADGVDVEPDDRLERDGPGDDARALEKMSALFRRTSAAASAASSSCGPMRCWRRLRTRRAQPVKVALPRPFMFNNTPHRPQRFQRVHRRDARRQDPAIGHELVGDLAGGADRRRRSDRRACAMPAPTASPRRGSPCSICPKATPCGHRVTRQDRWLEIAMDEMAESSSSIPSSSVFSTTRRSIPSTPNDPSRSVGSSSACAPAQNASAGRSVMHSLPSSRWAMVDWPGRRHRFSRQSCDKVSGARAARWSRHRHGRNRHDRHRHWQLHDHRSDGRRDDGRAAAQRGRASGRLSLPGVVGLRRPVGRGQCDVGSLAACVKLREAVAQKLGFNPLMRCSKMAASARALAACLAEAGSGTGLVAEDAIEFGSWQEVPADELRRALRRSRRRRRNREFVCGVCSRYALRAASSIRSRRVARSSAR